MCSRRQPRLFRPAALSLACLALCSSCSDEPDGTALTSSRAYKGHENDSDTNNFVSVYPATLGTRLDDCQTCHQGGTFTESGKTVSKNACDFCHLIIHPSDSISEAQPTSYVQTLNAFGAAYLAAGRNKNAFWSIDGQDSDGDGAVNGEEIADLKYPGDAASKPGQPNAPRKVFTLAQLRAMPHHTEFLLCNASKQQFDNYASYTGVKVRDLLNAAGVDPDDPHITGVTVIAPDGFLKDISMSNVNNPYPAGKFFAALDTATLGPMCGFVQYPNQLPANLVDGGDIPGEQWLAVAWERDGAPMESCSLDPTSGRINGEGPLRLVVPQATPGRPDRGSQYSPTTCSDGMDFDPAKDHNAGAMVRGVVAIRINPLPAGVEDFDAKNGGWAYITNSTLIVYGYGVE